VPALVPLALVGGAVAAVVGVPGVGLPVLSGGTVATVVVVSGVELPAVSGSLVGSPLIGGPLIGGPLVCGALVALIRRWLLHRVLRIPHDCPSYPRTGSRPVAVVTQLAA